MDIKWLSDTKLLCVLQDWIQNDSSLIFTCTKGMKKKRDWKSYNFPLICLAWSSGWGEVRWLSYHLQCNEYDPITTFHINWLHTLYKMTHSPMNSELSCGKIVQTQCTKRELRWWQFTVWFKGQKDWVRTGNHVLQFKCFHPGLWLNKHQARTGFAQALQMGS